MLTEMKTKGEGMQNEEEKIFATYAEWVDDRTTDLGFEVKTFERNIEQLKAIAEASNSKVEELGRNIAAHDSEINRLNKEKADATSERKSEKDEYLRLQKEYEQSLGALERALERVSAEDVDGPEAATVLLQLRREVPSAEPALAALSQLGQEETGAPAAAAYEFQSTSLVQTLEALHKKFRQQLSEAATAEANRAHNYDLVMLQVKDSLTEETADKGRLAAEKAETAAVFSKVKGDLADTSKQVADAKVLLQEIKATFQAKSSTYERNKKVRQDELKTLAKAIELMSATKLTQFSSAPALLLQTGRSTTGLSNTRSRVAAYLRRRANALASRNLQVLAAKVAANPFQRVVNMIENLIAKLKKDMNAESAHKAWCDKELKKSKLKRQAMSTRVYELSAKVDQLTVEIAKVGKRIRTLDQEQANLAKAMSQAVATREKEKTSNEKTITEAQSGSTAVKQALVLLTEFYRGQASLLQQGQQQAPEMAEYKGMQGSSKGIMGMLEVIQSDFMQLGAETKAAEENAAREHDSFMSEAMAEKDSKRKLSAKLSLRKDEMEFQKAQKAKDVSESVAILTKAKQYFEGLKQSCLDVQVDYSERVARRQDEIAALKEAYKIVDSKSDDA